MQSRRVRVILRKKKVGIGIAKVLVIKFSLINTGLYHNQNSTLFTVAHYE